MTECREPLGDAVHLPRPVLDPDDPGSGYRLWLPTRRCRSDPDPAIHLHREQRFRSSLVLLRSTNVRYFIFPPYPHPYHYHFQMTYTCLLPFSTTALLITVPTEWSSPSTPLLTSPSPPTKPTQRPRHLPQQAPPVPQQAAQQHLVLSLQLALVPRELLHLAHPQPEPPTALLQ